MVGGTLAVVAADVNGRGARYCRALQSDLVATYRADFAKYSGRMDRGVLDLVLLAVAGSIGRKFVYARVGEGVKRHQTRAALELLADARLCRLVRHSAANGLPLGAEVNERFRKVMLADVGLLHALLSTPAVQTFPRWERLAARLRGQIAEQLVGQQLRLAVDRLGDPSDVYYWQRGGGRQGRVDFLVQLHGAIVPVEIKSGTAGSMKSLHQFMHDKGLPIAVRCDANPPSSMTIDVATTLGQPVAYDLISVPLYLCSSLPDIL